MNTSENNWTSLTYIIGLAFCLFLISCSKPPVVEETKTSPTILQIRNKPITLAEYEFFVERKYPEMVGPIDNESHSTFFDVFKRDLILAEISQLLGFRIREDQIDGFIHENLGSINIRSLPQERQDLWRAEVARRLAIRELLERKVLKSDDLEDISFSEEEIRAHYEANQKQFQTQPLYRVRFMRTDSEDKAKNFRKALRKTRKHFKELANEFTESESHKAAMPLYMDDLSEPFQKAIQRMRPGQHSKIIPVKQGSNEVFYVLYLESIISAVQISYEDAYHYIVNQLHRQHCASRLQETLDKFSKGRGPSGQDTPPLIPIQINWEALPFTYSQVPE